MKMKFFAIIMVLSLALFAAGCGKSHKTGPCTLTIIVKDSLDTSPIENVSVTLESTQATALTDSAGIAVFENALAPYTITLEAPGEQPMTIYGATGRSVELLLSVKSVPKRTALITVTGVNSTSIPPGMGDTDGTIFSSGLSSFGSNFSLAEGGLGNYSVSGTSTAPSPIPVSVESDKPIILGTLVQSQLGYPLKYGYTQVTGGVASDNQAVTVAAVSFITNPPSLFRGTLDFSGLQSMEPGTGFMAAFAEIPDYEPWACGFGEVSLTNSTYNGMIINIANASTVMATFLVEDNSSGAISGRIIRGPKADFGAGEWDMAVQFMDVPVLTAPDNGATLSTAVPTFSWTRPRSDAYVMLRIEGPSGFEWTALVIDGRTTVELPARLALTSGGPYVWRATAAVIPKFKLSGFTVSKLWDTVTHVSISCERSFNEQ
jgi:hypothetical protein